ncbi:MAG: TRAP transporter TatT component family protein [Spirochaetaceae bacterium]|jgi:predicted anti-sigma-YlaC factor YlaD|nr:TRAP transporter TatT component family protein [Spirochaetaceae bacterium]
MMRVFESRLHGNVFARFGIIGLVSLVFLSCTTSPAFVGKALPSIIAGNERKLEKKPGDKALILETGQYYISYANAFVDAPAEMLPSEQYEKKVAEKTRAKELYLRGIEILDTAENVDDDVDFLYWKATGVLAAFALDPFDYSTGLGAKLAGRIAMLHHAYEINPDYNNGALDEMLFRIYISLPAELGGNKDEARRYYERALEKSKGLRPGIFVTWAQSVSVPAQDYAEFKTMLERALAINPNKDKANTLANKLDQKKARWLLEHAGNFFVEVE